MLRFTCLQERGYSKCLPVYKTGDRAYLKCSEVPVFREGSNWNLMIYPTFQNGKMVLK